MRVAIQLAVLISALVSSVAGCRDHQTPLGPALRANALGEYVVAGGPAGTTVKVTCQGAEAPGKLAARVSSAHVMLAETAIHNATPRIVSVQAMAGDRPTGVVAAGRR